MPSPDLVDEFLPEYDVSDSVARVVAAERESTWRALVSADLIEVGRRRPMVAFLGFSRLLPELASHLLHGEAIPNQPEHLRLKETTQSAATDGGWMLLGEREPEELALGLVGKFWRPVIEYAALERSEFRAFAEPGWAKTVYDLQLNRIDNAHTLLTGTMRTATTDDRARRWFRRYWTLGVGAGAHVLVDGLLDLVAEQAEASAASVPVEV
jgi:hypothetical protein